MSKVGDHLLYPLFVTWKYNGAKFMAIRNAHETYTVVDEHENHYGSWNDLAEFRYKQRLGNSPWAKPISKIAYLSHRAIICQSCGAGFPGKDGRCKACITRTEGQ